MSEEKEARKAREAAAMAESVNILMLQDTIKNLEESKVRLLLTVKELKEKMEQQKADQADIYYYLNKKCDESFEIIASLEEQLSNEQSDREIAEKMYEIKIDELRTILQATESKMGAKIVDLESKVEMLNQFSLAKEETDRQLTELSSTLERERAENRQTLEMLENKFLLEREKLRASYDLKYESLKKDLEQSIDGKLTKKTQRTQIMNVVMKKELEAQSRHADRLLEINDSIVERDRKLKMELDLANSLREELLKKCNAYTRTNRELEKKVAEGKEEQEKALKALQDEYAAKLEEAEDLKSQLLKERVRNNQKTNKVDELWFFLSRAYQILGVSKKAANLPEEQTADFYSKVLYELFKHLSVKFPDFMTRFMSEHRSVTPSAAASTSVHSALVGQDDTSVTTSQVSKDDVGIFSWRADRFQDQRPQRVHIPTRSMGVQTDYMSAMDNFLAASAPPAAPQFSTSSNTYVMDTNYSLWRPAAAPGQLSVDGEGSQGSVGGYSLPTVMGNTNSNNPHGSRRMQNNAIRAGNILHNSSIMSTVTQEEDDEGPSGDLQEGSLAGRSVQTMGGPLPMKKPGYRQAGASHHPVTKGRKLKPRATGGFAGDNGRAGSGDASAMLGLLDEWQQEGLYLDRAVRGLSSQVIPGGNASGANPLRSAVNNYLMDDGSIGSLSTASFLDLSVSGRKYMDPHTLPKIH